MEAGGAARAASSSDVHSRSQSEHPWAAVVTDRATRSSAQVLRLAQLRFIETGAVDTVALELAAALAELEDEAAPKRVRNRQARSTTASRAETSQSSRKLTLSPAAPRGINPMSGLEAPRVELEDIEAELKDGSLTPEAAIELVEANMEAKIAQLRGEMQNGLGSPPTSRRPEAMNSPARRRRTGSAWIRVCAKASITGSGLSLATACKSALAATGRSK